MFHLQRAISKDLSFRSFIMAGVIMALAVAGREALDQSLPDTPPFITLYPAMALVGLFCGPLAAGVTGLIGLLAAIFLWIPPRMSFAVPSFTNCVSIALFVISSSMMVWASAILRKELNCASIAKQALELGLDAGGIGIWQINLRTQQITASKTAYALHGLPENTRQSVADDWLRGVPPDDAANARTVLREAVTSGTSASYAYCVHRGGGELRSIAARGRVVSAGRERHLICALVDITEQIRIQDELRRERERLRLALEAGALAVWDFNPSTDQAEIDIRYAVTMGFDPSVNVLTREQIGARIHPDDLPRVAAEHEELAASEAKYRIEFRLITPSGDIRWLVSQGIVIKGDVPDRGRLVGIIQDITDQKRREDNLREQAAARELLIREADHRIKNSLQLVMSTLALQMRDITDGTAADVLRQAIARVGAIAASHLALQGREDFKQIDLAVSLRDLCAHLEKLHPATPIVCRTDATLLLDADRAIPLGLVINELLTNALRHAFPNRKSGTVTVEALLNEGQLSITVKDDGIGMENVSSHSGLGSKIIRLLAAQLDATINVENAPTSGTIVTVRTSLLPKEGAKIPS